MPPHKILTLWDAEQINEEETQRLRTPCTETPVPFDAETVRAVRTLREAFLERDDAVGLAAPQIGIPRRIIAFRVRGFDDREAGWKEGDYEILVNPRITQSRGEPVVGEEGCLSCPEIRVEIARFPEIKLRAYDAQGHKVSRRYLDFAARVVQHELDHLDGRLIIDHEGAVYIPTQRRAFFDRYFRER